MTLFSKNSGQPSGIAWLLSAIPFGNWLMLIPIFLSAYYLIAGVYAVRLAPAHLEITLVLLVAVGLLTAAKTKSKTAVIPRVAVFFASLTLAPFTFSNYLIGKTDTASILFHIEFGLAGFDFFSVLPEVLLVLTIWFSFNIAFGVFGRRARFSSAFAYFFAFSFIVANPITVKLLTSVGQTVGVLTQIETFEIRDLYVRTDVVSAPEQKKNLVIIYLEGMERTYADSARFGDTFQSITDIQADSLQFTNIQQAKYTEWSIAGLVASQCGVPLFRHGTFFRNKFDRQSEFMPNANCLGDILSTHGYTTAFMTGTNAAFAGIDIFNEKHGYQDIIQLSDLAELGNNDFTSWGVHDDVVLDYAQNRLVDLDSLDAPYSLIIQTNDTHGPIGFLAPECRNEPNVRTSRNILLAVDCTATLVAKFVTFASENIDMSDTVIILLSDHLAHANNVTALLKESQRQNTFLAFGADIQPGVNSSLGSMIDVFPTILDMLDFEIGSTTAGLGVSLLSDNPTLTEQYGLRSLNQTLFEDNYLSGVLWAVQ